jgi:hypothetical protein
MFERVRNLFFYRAICPSCAIVFRISKFESGLARYLPSPYGQRFFVYPSPGAHRDEDRHGGPDRLSMKEAEMDLRPAPAPVRVSQAAELPKVITHEAPIRLGIHSSYFGVDLDIALKPGKFLEDLKAGATTLMRNAEEFGKTTLLPACKHWLNPEPPAPSSAETPLIKELAEEEAAQERRSEMIH